MKKPTRMAIVLRACTDPIWNTENSGSSKCLKTGWTSTPRAMLATVIPNCVAPMNASRWAIIWRATLARRLPRASSGPNCVSRMRTRASSAATKKPLKATSRNTAMILQLSSTSSFQFISEADFPKDDFEDVLQSDDSDFLSVPAQDHGEALTAALHSAKRRFEAEILIQIQSRAHVIRGCFVQGQVRLVEDGGHADQAGDPALPVLAFPDRQPGHATLAADGHHFAHGGVGCDSGGDGNGFGDVPNGQTLQVEDAVDHRAFFSRECLGGFLHEESQFFPVSEKVAGEGFGSGPIEQEG